VIEADQRDNRRRNFALRVASAAVLAPAVLVLTYVGSWPFLALCLLGALGILYEWTLLAGLRATSKVHS
jgi:phosphatidate cytidylyltransferase